MRYDPELERNGIMKKFSIAAVVLAGITMMSLTGCSVLHFIQNNGDLCSLINCTQLGLVDVSGPSNDLVPTQPNYSKDPTCTLPGLCGANYWYPFATSDPQETTSTGDAD